MWQCEPCGSQPMLGLSRALASWSRAAVVRRCYIGLPTQAQNAVCRKPYFAGFFVSVRQLAEREGLSEGFFHSAGCPEKEASPAGYWDTLRTTSRPTFAAPNPPKLKWRRPSKRAISCLAHG